MTAQFVTAQPGEGDKQFQSGIGGGDHAQEQVLGADPLVAQLIRFAQRKLKGRLSCGGKRDVSFWALANAGSFFGGGVHDLEGDAE